MYDDIFNSSLEERIRELERLVEWLLARAHEHPEAYGQE